MDQQNALRNRNKGVGVCAIIRDGELAACARGSVGSSH